MENGSVLDVVVNAIFYGCVAAFVCAEVLFLDSIGVLRPALVVITLLGMTIAVAEQYSEQRVRYQGRVR